MSITIECPGCGSDYRVNEERAGTRLKCKHCGDVLKVPMSSGAPQRQSTKISGASRAPLPPRASARGTAPRASRKGASRERWSDWQRLLIICGLGGVVTVGIAFGIMHLASNSDTLPPQSDEASAARPALPETEGGTTWTPLDGWEPAPAVVATLQPAAPLPGLPEVHIQLPPWLTLGKQHHDPRGFWKVGWRGPRRDDPSVAALIVSVNKVPAGTALTEQNVMVPVNAELDSARRVLSSNWAQMPEESIAKVGGPVSRITFRGSGRGLDATGRAYWRTARNSDASYVLVAIFFDAEEHAGTTLPPIEAAALSLGLGDPGDGTTTGTPASVAPISTDLFEARRGFQTKLVRRGKSPQAFENEPAPPGVELVHYPSRSLELKAWVSANPSDGRRHPAVVFLHGGWSFGAQDWRDAEPFRQAGYVVMMPMLRAENGNPGEFELFYGEVDDAIAAGDYVASLEYVDPNRIFIVGHSAGGMLTPLVAMMPSRFKAAAAFSGMVDHAAFVRSHWGRIVPYDLSDPEEIRLRNPREFVASLKCPLYLFLESGHADLNATRAFTAAAQSFGRTCEFFSVPGDHWTMVVPSLRKTIELFNAAGD